METLSTSRINLTLINQPDLQYLLYDIKDQIRSHHRFNLPTSYKLL